MRNNSASNGCAWFACLWLLAACGGNDKPGPAEGQPEPGSTPQTTNFRTSNRNLVQWKRAAAIEADLMRALELSRDELCKELGDRNCIRDVHLVPLGGNEPYVSGLMRPSGEPLATTPPVIDRVLLKACSTRAELDSHAKPKVFRELAFDKPLSAAGEGAIKGTITALYRRLLARDPEAHEIETVASLRDDDELSPRDFAALACFSIGSTTEFLFF